MIANYHTHTVRCHHASGTDEEYVKAAIRRGVRILGFSDHSPQFYKDGYVSDAKMLPCEMDEYVSSVLALKKTYQNDIDIRLGFEAEYYPLFFNDLINACRAYPIDYLILGQHHVGNEGTPDDFIAFRKTDDPLRLHRFIDQEIEAMETGRFTYLAHPDVIAFTGDEGLYREECSRLILRAKALDIPLEINLLGLTFGRSYPNPVFWDLVGELGAPAVIGCDAHEPERVANPEELRRADAFAKEHRVIVRPTVELRSPCF